LIVVDGERFVVTRKDDGGDDVTKWIASRNKRE